MSLESQIYAALEGLVGGRVHPDFAPNDEPQPYITYQKVGGAAINFLDKATPDKSFSRVQVSVWGGTRIEISAIAKSVETALRNLNDPQVTVIAEPVSMYDPDTQLRGSRQDFELFT